MLNQNRLRGVAARLCVATVIGGILKESLAADDAAPPAELDKAFAALAAASRAVDRPHFDPQAVLETVGRDPAVLADWVRRSVAYVPYQGALRGPAGVLMDGTANACDRAWLLAELLRSSGYEVRLARATLDDTGAQAVLATVVAPQRPTLSTEPLSDAQAAALAKATDTDVAVIQANDAAGVAAAREAVTLIKGRTATQSKTVLELTAAFEPTRSDDDATALAAAKDHWWVQAKIENAWADFDPTRPVADKPAPAGSTVDLPQSGPPTLAEKDAHSVRIRLLVERDENGKRAEQPVFDHTYRTADLAAEGISITQPPIRRGPDHDLNKASDPVKALREMDIGQKQWLPIVTVGEKTDVGRAFDDAGNVTDRPGLEAAGLGKSTGDLFGGLAGGGEAKAGLLSAETIEYTVHSPGRPDAIVRRPVFDLVGPAARAVPAASATKITDDDRQKRARLITARIDVLVLGGELHGDGIMAVQMRKAAKLRKLLPLIGKTETLVSAYEKTYTPDLLYTTQILRQAVAPRSDRTYLDRPNILTAYRALGSAGRELTCRVTIDVSYNPVAVRPMSGGGDDAFTVRVMQGITDTACERAVLRGADDTIENTTELFARAGDAAPIAARAVTDLPAAAKNLPADVQARVAGQIGDGYALVMPPAPVTGSAGPRYGWYRVDPKTGDTVGVNDAGLNAAITEKAAVDQLNALKAPGAAPITSLNDFAGMGLKQMLQRLGYTIESISGPAERALWEKLLTQFMKWGMRNSLKAVRYGAWA